MMLDQLSPANTAAIAVMRAEALLETPTPIPEELITGIFTGQKDQQAAATPEPTEQLHVSAYSLLQENDDYPAVQKLQTRLMELGYLDSDEPTTVYNAATSAAVSLYQRTLSYEMNGVADSALQERLFSGEAEAYEMKLGDEGSDVKSMQLRLTELGYYEDKASGFFGAVTEDAVKAFQKKNKLDVDGVFNVDDRELLFSPSARPAIDPTPTPKPTPKPTKRPSSSSSSSSSGSSGSSGSSSGESESSGDSSYSASYSASGIISVAKAQKGKSYVWSQEGPNTFDCSGLVYFCLRTCGVKVSRYSASGFSKVDSWGYVGSANDLKKGDLVFFKSDSSSSVNHTGIYLGSGSFIHASSSAGKVIVSSITTAYWTRNFVNGRRVF